MLHPDNPIGDPLTNQHCPPYVRINSVIYCAILLVTVNSTCRANECPVECHAFNDTDVRMSSSELSVFCVIEQDTLSVLLQSTLLNNVYKMASHLRTVFWGYEICG